MYCHRGRGEVSFSPGGEKWLYEWYTLMHCLVSKSSVTGCDSLGSQGCPRLSDTPIMEPVVLKKIAHERLTALLFRYIR
jgi:hypothetical protein